MCCNLKCAFLFFENVVRLTVCDIPPLGSICAPMTVRRKLPQEHNSVPRIHTFTMWFGNTVILNNANKSSLKNQQRFKQKVQALQAAQLHRLFFLREPHKLFLVLPIGALVMIHVLTPHKNVTKGTKDCAAPL